MTRKKTERSYDDLPEDIMRKILLKLAVKPLMVCRCVSTEWLHIISDKAFCKTHAQHHRAPLTRKLIVSTADGVELLNLDDPAQDRSLRCPFKKPDSPIRLLSVCNGLLVASDGEWNCYIWNPSTGFNTHLPLPWEIRNGAPFGERPHSFECDHYGFGYVSESDDYKILVSVATDFFDDVKGWINWVYVYSWRSQTWTKIESPFNHWLKRIMEERTDVFVNNNLHWFDDMIRMDPGSYDEDEDRLEKDECGLGILAFDLVQHEFRRINLPPNFDNDEPDDDEMYFSYMGVWREKSLYVLRYEEVDVQTAQLWFINEYGVNVEWTRFYTLNLEEVIMRSLVLEGRDTDLISIDVEQGHADNIIQLLSVTGKFNFYAYQETLLSVL